MKSFNTKGTEVTPQIQYDEESRVLKIEGRSIPADADQVFAPLKNWVQNLVQSDQKHIVIDMNLEYFNTASHKHLAELFRQVSQNIEESHVNWHHHYDDDEMKQVGEIFDRIFPMKFIFISFDDED